MVVGKPGGLRERLQSPAYQWGTLGIGLGVLAVVMQLVWESPAGAFACAGAGAVCGLVALWEPDIKERWRNRVFRWQAVCLLLGLFASVGELTNKSGLFVFGLVAASAVCGLVALWVSETPRRLWERVSKREKSGISEQDLRQVKRNWEKAEQNLALGGKIPLFLEREGEEAGPVRLEELANLVEEGKTVVLVGDPGAGKTSLLRDLDDLLRERRSELDRVPVLLSLARWARDHSLLDDWSAKELAVFSGLGRAKAENLVGMKYVVLLLDGLGEMPDEDRKKCAGYIEEYQENYGAGFVVSCQTEHWKGLRERFNQQRQKQSIPGWSFVSNAVVIRISPLTPTRINNFFVQEGERLSEFARTLHGLPGLFEALDSPLLLETTAAVFKDEPTEDLQHTVQKAKKETWQDWLFTQYTEKRLSCRPSGDDRQVWGPNGKARRWLGWPAAVTRAQGKSVFYLDKHKIDWLPKREGFRAVGTHLAAAFLLCGLPVTLATLVSGEIFGRLIAALASSEAVSLILVEDRTLPVQESGPWLALVAWIAGDWPSSFLLGCATSIGAIAVFGSHREISQTHFSWQWTNSLSLSHFPSRLITGVLFSAGTGAVFAVLLAFVVGLRIGFETEVYDMLSQSILPWLIVGGTGGFLAGVVNAVVRDLEDEETLAQASSGDPDLGSLRNGLSVLVFTLLFFSCAGLAAGLFLHQIDRPLEGLLAGFVSGLPFGLILAWRYGLGIWAWSLIFPRSLARADLLSFQGTHFFDKAVEKGLLRRCDDVYYFPHPTLQEVLEKNTSLPISKSTFRTPNLAYRITRDLILFFYCFYFIFLGELL